MISRYKNFLYFGLMAVAVMTLVALHFWKSKKYVEEDYVNVSNAFHKWIQEGDKKHDSVGAIEKMLKKHPELSPQYGSLIGQQFLASGAAHEAKHYIEKALKRASHPYYSEFAKTSVTITEGDYSQALEEAISLKSEMMKAQSKEIEKGSLLHAFNLLRIAMIQGEVNDKAGELSAWDELRQYAGWDTTEQKGGKEVCALLLSHLTVQQRSLLDYIAFRENQLTH